MVNNFQLWSYEFEGQWFFTSALWCNGLMTSLTWRAFRVKNKKQGQWLNFWWLSEENSYNSSPTYTASRLKTIRITQIMQKQTSQECPRSTPPVRLKKSMWVLCFSKIVLFRQKNGKITFFFWWKDLSELLKFVKNFVKKMKYWQRDYLVQNLLPEETLSSEIFGICFWKNLVYVKKCIMKKFQTQGPKFFRTYKHSSRIPGL